MTFPTSPDLSGAGRPGSSPPRNHRWRRTGLALLAVLTTAAVGGTGYALGAQRGALAPAPQPTQSAAPAPSGHAPAGAAQREPQQTDPARRAGIDAKGAQVMPFDLARTQHVFTNRPDGGVQTVTALDPADKRNIELIREHLRKEADRFARGDFADPTAIHGQDMPGLAELKAGAARIRVRYEQLPDGARLRYTTTDPELVEAIHSWFRAQSRDHGVEHQAS